jgi:hypothetical protein
MSIPEFYRRSVGREIAAHNTLEQRRVIAAAVVSQSAPVTYHR